MHSWNIQFNSQNIKFCKTEIESRGFCYSDETQLCKVGLCLSKDRPLTLVRIKIHNRDFNLINVLHISSQEIFSINVYIYMETMQMWTNFLDGQSIITIYVSK